MTDIEIARAAKPENILNIAAKLGIDEKYLFCYGKDKAKVSLDVPKNDQRGKIILVTAMTPTPAGEGKTTVSIGLADALALLGKKTAAALREPSLGPVFGIKGGAAGGGYSQVIPMEDINLHFTGDLHAIGTANNLLAALTDNSIQQGNPLGLDVRRIELKRCVDMNDRQLRFITDGLGGKANGVPREDGFDITVASEVMAALCLSTSLTDLKKRLSMMIVGYSFDGSPVTAGDIKAAGAMTVLLKDAVKPNLVQTLAGTPAFIHGGPFANIAHGCNSVIATDLASSLADYTVTEAGFGADLGAEKFFDIKCATSGLRPSCAVIVATVRALKYHGGIALKDLSTPDAEAVKRGMPNLLRHLANMREVYRIPCVVAINRRSDDSAEEIDAVINACANAGEKAVPADVWAKGGEGGTELAQEVIALCEKPSELHFAYDMNDKIEEKLRSLATRVYRGKGVKFTPQAQKQLEEIDRLGFSGLPVCTAKTQYSFSDDPALLCAPEEFDVTVRELKVSAGAGFVVAKTGSIMTMPGLPKRPAAENIDIDENGVITGLF